MESSDTEVQQMPMAAMESSYTEVQQMPMAAMEGSYTEVQQMPMAATQMCAIKYFVLRFILSLVVLDSFYLHNTEVF